MEKSKKTNHELSNEDWERVKPLFQDKLGKRWRTRQEADRIILNGLLWKMKTGAPWRDLPKKYGYWGTAYQRFKRWRDLGLWEKILAALTSQKNQANHDRWKCVLHLLITLSMHLSFKQTDLC